ncbi:phosphatidate cytidylyltransferase [Opitutaceae bacterium TAV5]|nr:phosphatidate cytidylyltransferase [Opitutaceae bacterium TAV5]
MTPEKTLWTAFGAVGLVLVAATITIALLARRHPMRDWRELTLRVRTWWIIVAVFAVAITFNNTVSVVVFGFVSFLAFKEYLTLVPTRRADHLTLLWAYLAIPVQYWWVYDGWYGMFIIFIPIYMFLFLPMRMVFIGETQGFLRSAATLHWGLMTTVYCLSHMAFLIVLPGTAVGGAAGNGPLLVLYLVVLTQANDVAQYLWGKSLGRGKIVPKVSPGKTTIGFLGGAATTTALGGVLGPVLTPMNWQWSLASGLLIGVTGFVGDVVVSAVKRDIGVKDSGDLLPGHGGILDRLDSLTYTAPLFFHFLRYLYY